MIRPAFLVTVDTEGDNLWSRPCFVTTSRRAASRFRCAVHWRDDMLLEAPAGASGRPAWTSGSRARAECSVHLIPIVTYV